MIFHPLHLFPLRVVKPLNTLVQKSNNKLEENVAQAAFMPASIPLEGRNMYL